MFDLILEVGVLVLDSGQFAAAGAQVILYLGLGGVGLVEFQAEEAQDEGQNGRQGPEPPAVYFAHVGGRCDWRRLLTRLFL